MTVVALLSVAPVIEDSMASEVAKAVAALEDFEVGYETNPMRTVIEAEDVDTLLAAVGAAHKAVDGDRVSTFLKLPQLPLEQSSVDRPISRPFEPPPMTVVALLSVAPVRDGSMAEDVADAVAALDDFDVSYEMNPMGTVIETDSIDELLAAVAAAHKAVDGDRVSTFLKVDDKRTSDESARDKVEHVEDHLGKPAKRDRDK